MKDLVDNAQEDLLEGSLTEPWAILLHKHGWLTTKKGKGKYERGKKGELTKEEKVCMTALRLALYYESG